jgi:soluble cytochrome b562
MSNLPKRPEWQRVVHQIFHHYAPIDLLEMMQMMPELIWTEALFIDKTLILFHTLDFRNPGHPHPRRNHHFVFNDLSLIHYLTRLIYNLKPQILWRDFIQISRTGEKIPSLLQTDRQKLFLSKRMNHHPRYHGSRKLQRTAAKFQISSLLSSSVLSSSKDVSKSSVSPSTFPLEDRENSIRILAPMKPKFLIAACAASMLFVIPAAADDTPLAKQMEILNDAYKAIKKEEDPAKGAALAKEAQDAMVKAIVELPEMVKAMPDGPDKAKASAEYRKMMGTLISSLAEMELAFHNKDLEKVKTIVEQLRESKKQGHDKFMDEDE